MPRELGLLVCGVLVIWLFLRENKIHPMESWASWAVLVWVAILGSRPLSAFFGASSEGVTPDDLVEGSPLDRNFFLVLMLFAAVALFRRRVMWGRIIASNRWLFFLLIYSAISIAWSDFPFVSFKRWTKELGSFLMVLVILTEEDPSRAIRGILIRYVYLIIPLSIAFIYYLPHLGTYYNEQIGVIIYSGVTTNKNSLGMTTFASGLFLIWDLIYQNRSDKGRNSLIYILTRVVLLSMALWLIYIAHSSTASVCTILGTAILLMGKIPVAKKRIKYLGTYSISLVFLLFFLYSTFPGTLDAFVGTFGRDTTFTGRTELWLNLLTEPINPLLGTGYQSFWLGARAYRFWTEYVQPRHAHNGYLELYLNCGLLGLSLLIGAILSSANNVKKILSLGNPFGMLFFAFLTTALFYNWTEASFGRHNLLWFIMIIVALYNPFSKDVQIEAVRSCRIKLHENRET